MTRLAELSRDAIGAANGCGRSILVQHNGVMFDGQTAGEFQVDRVEHAPQSQLQSNRVVIVRDRHERTNFGGQSMRAHSRRSRWAIALVLVVDIGTLVANLIQHRRVPNRVVFDCEPSQSIQCIDG